MRRDYGHRIDALSAQVYRLNAIVKDNQAASDRAVAERIAAKDTEIEQWRVRHAQAVEHFAQADAEVTSLLRQLMDIRKKLERMQCQTT
jgi:chromosome segregation ATPase